VTVRSVTSDSNRTSSSTDPFDPSIRPRIGGEREDVADAVFGEERHDETGSKGGPRSVRNLPGAPCFSITAASARAILVLVLQRIRSNATMRLPVVVDDTEAPDRDEAEDKDEGEVRAPERS
jgi:hypothetical protein